MEPDVTSPEPHMTAHDLLHFSLFIKSFLVGMATGSNYFQNEYPTLYAIFQEDCVKNIRLVRQKLYK